MLCLPSYRRGYSSSSLWTLMTPGKDTPRMSLDILFFFFFFFWLFGFLAFWLFGFLETGLLCIVLAVLKLTL
jgi:hypothetical protein